MAELSKDIMENGRLIAAAALFRNLHEEKLDKYDVLAEFINATISLNGLYTFTTKQIAESLNKDFGFNIPTAIISSCIKTKLKNSLSKKNNSPHWERRPEFKPNETLNIRFEKEKELKSKIINLLCRNAANILGREISEEESQNLENDLYLYLKGTPKQNINLPIIAEFILSQENNKNEIYNLDKTLEGLIIFEGFGYENHNHGQRFPRDIEIYLDTEVLFSSTGLNGELRKEIFLDLYNLISESNKRAKNHDGKIHLKYFRDAEDEINSFFSAAALIVEGKASTNPSKFAMMEIINGCKNKSDVLMKKSVFLAKLKELNINRTNKDNFFEPPIYNLESNSTIQELIDSFSCSEDQAIHVLKNFSRINFLRKGQNTGSFEEAGYFFLSEKNLVKQCNFNTSFSIGNRIPYSTELSYLTERLWFKLNKSFHTKNSLPKSFDLIAKTRLVLSSHLNNKVNIEYKKLIKAKNESDIDINNETLAIYLDELTKKLINPEQITSENIDFEFIFNNDYIATVVSDYEKIKKSAQQNKVSEQIISDLNKEKKSKEDEIKKAKLLNEQITRKFYRREKNKSTMEKIKILKTTIVTSFIISLFVISWLIFIIIDNYLSENDT